MSYVCSSQCIDYEIETCLFVFQQGTKSRLLFRALMYRHIDDIHVSLPVCTLKQI